MENVNFEKNIHYYYVVRGVHKIVCADNPTGNNNNNNLYYYFLFLFFPLFCVVCVYVSTGNYLCDRRAPGLGGPGGLFFIIRWPRSNISVASSARRLIQTTYSLAFILKNKGCPKLYTCIYFCSSFTTRPVRRL